MAHDIQPEGIHSTLVRVAGDGQILDTAAVTARSAGDDLSGAFGTASTAQTAFSVFWTECSGTGERLSNLILHQASCVADAAEAFIESDGTMSSDGRSAMGSLADITAPADEG
ncbi:hypothetical protein GCM10010977_18940 [Citricoccus zhacaiensis]|uniref:ESX-1 secretion-associated protein n=1 Tax=Citricoccus zhacaiensis TaxID=489142 RepID=A0ABQ2M452_9MICC|nr:hypothetical protein [Citricoccus zhacaiensis]GGO45693.1 hypothetical protein GCM10010977_18940 [Citricoccus zhacaiensis]